MPATFPASRAETSTDGLGEIAFRPRHIASDDSPEFALLDVSGPHPGALLLSFGMMSALVVVTVILARPLRSSPPVGAEMLTAIVIAPRPLWLRADPPPRDLLQNATPHSDGADPVKKLRQASMPEYQVEAAARVEAPVVVIPSLHLDVPPLAVNDVLSPVLKMPPAPPSPAPIVAAEARKLTADAPGTLTLPQFIDREAALAARLATLTPGQRRALPRVSIRVDADWLEVLPQTKEELYFSTTRPQGDTEILAYMPATHSFILKRPLQPLWQIREGERVPALAALRSAAAGRLGVSPEFVDLYTWHPPVLENALRMFVLARMDYLRVQLGPSDVVTVRFASGPGGCLMSLEPIRRSE